MSERESRCTAYQTLVSIDVIGHAMRYRREREEDAEWNKAHTTVPAFDAIRGQRSACQERVSASDLRAIAESSTYTFFCDGTSDGRTLHLTLGVDDNTSVVLEIHLARLSHTTHSSTHLEVEEHTVSPTPCLALANDDSWHG